MQKKTNKYNRLQKELKKIWDMKSRVTTVCGELGFRDGGFTAAA